MARAKWLSVWVLWTVACGEPEILGESGCDVGHAACNEVPVFEDPLTRSQTASIPFELLSPQARAATWTVLLSPLPENGWTNLPLFKVEPAPDEGVWVAQFRDSTRFLLRLDRSGREVASFPRPAMARADELFGDLSVSSTLRPVVEWNRYDDRDATRRESGAYVWGQETGLTHADASGDLNPSTTIAGTDGTLRIASVTEDKQVSVHELGSSGTLTWTRAVPYPSGFEPLGVNRMVVPGLTLIKDGSTLMSWEVHTDRTPLPTELSLLTMVDAGGVIRWHMKLPSAAPVAALETGGFATASRSLSGFYVWAFDQDAGLLGNWKIEQTGYYGGMASSITSDSSGGLYFALLTGNRRSPQVKVCKVEVYADSIPPLCLDIEGASGGTAQIGDLASPAPGAVVVVYGTSPDSDTLAPLSWKASRIDF